MIQNCFNLSYSYILELPDLWDLYNCVFHYTQYLFIWNGDKSLYMEFLKITKISKVVQSAFLKFSKLYGQLKLQCYTCTKNIKDKYCKIYVLNFWTLPVTISCILKSQYNSGSLKSSLVLLIGTFLIVFSSMRLHILGNSR